MSLRKGFSYHNHNNKPKNAETHPPDTDSMDEQ